MDTLQLPIARATRRAPPWLAAGALCLGVAACAGMEPRDEHPGGNVDALAARLVQTARERADLRQIRVWVAEIHETRREPTVAAARGTPDDLVGLRLEHELVIALATRLNVVESEMVEPALATPETPLGQGAAARGATHVLVGDYVRQRDAIQITLRLVDAETRLIVAAARGSVKLADIGLGSFDRWAVNDKDRGTLAVPGTEPRARVTQLSPQPGPQLVPEPNQAASQVPPAPAAASAKPQTTLVPIGADSGAEPAKTAASTVAPSRAWPVEDFETWRQRRMEEQRGSVSQTVAALDEAARSSTEPAVRARRNELAGRPETETEQFPWRSNPWLARLLGIPKTPPSDQR